MGILTNASTSILDPAEYLPAPSGDDSPNPYQQAQALNDAISRLPSDQRARARSNPRAFFGEQSAGLYPEVPAGFQLGTSGMEKIKGHTDAIIRQARERGMDYAPPGFAKGPLGQLIPVPGRLAPIGRVKDEQRPIVPRPSGTPLTKAAGTAYMNEVRAGSYRAALKDKAALASALRDLGINEQHDLSTDDGQRKAARVVSRHVASSFVSPENLSASDRAFVGKLLDRLTRSEGTQAVYDEVLDKVAQRVTDRAVTFRTKHPQTQEGWEEFNRDWAASLESRPLFNDEERAALEAKAPPPEPAIEARE